MFFLKYVVVLLVIGLSRAIPWFHFNRGPSFRGKAFFDVSERLDLNYHSGYVTGMGDFNNDKHLDFVIVKKKEIEIWIWKPSTWKFIKSYTYVAEKEIHQVNIVDLNQDGWMDLMIVWEQDYLDVFGLMRNSENLKEYEFIPENVLSDENIPLQQLSIIDANSDMHVDFLGYNKEKKPILWIKIDSHYAKLSLQGDPGKQVILPFTPAFADIDGDCVADLVLTTCSQTYQTTCKDPLISIYLNKEGSLEFFESYAAPAGIGRITIDDINRDGNSDIMFSVCYPDANCAERNEIQIWYNDQKPMCSTSWFPQKNCRKQTNLCTAEAFTFGNTIDVIQLGLDRKIYKDVNRPATLRTGDINSDGYSDIALVVENLKKERKVEIWLNTQCNERLCSQSNLPWSEKNRTFDVLDSGIQSVEKFKNPYAAFFFDLDETGTLDLVTLGDNKNGSLGLYYNNYNWDTFFFKCMGVVRDNSKSVQGSYPGFTFKFVIPISDVTTGRTPRIGTQLSSTNYLSLQTPYYSFGLGRINSYIENAFFGVPSSMRGHSNIKHEPGIIPNSQIIALYNRGSWELQLFVNPASYLVWVIVGVVLTLIILGCFSSCVWYCQFRADRKDKNKQKLRGFL